MPENSVELIRTNNWLRRQVDLMLDQKPRHRWYDRRHDLQGTVEEIKEQVRRSLQNQ